MIEQNRPETLIKGKQRNHGHYYMPVSIRHLGDMPLYRAVAWWGLLHGEVFTREDISQAFHIEPRRASGILNYICHRNNKGDISFEVSNRAIQGAHNLLVLRILAVNLRTQGKRTPRGPTRSVLTGNNDRVMARWMLSRPSSNNPERLARWKAAFPATISESEK